MDVKGVWIYGVLVSYFIILLKFGKGLNFIIDLVRRLFEKFIVSVFGYPIVGFIFLIVRKS